MLIRNLKYANLIFFIIMIAINMIANTVPLGHGNTGAISAKYPNLFTPAPITFSIWGVIYLLMAYFIVYQFGVLDMILADNLVKQIGIWFVISCIMNVGWIFSWHYEKTWLSMIFMLGLLISLIVITSRISPGIVGRMTGPYIGSSETAMEEASWSVPFLAKINMYGFDIYLGWITAATIANMSVLLVKTGWDRFGMSEEFWTIVVLLVGTLLGALFIITSQRYLSALTIIWAYSGILTKHISQGGYAGKYPIIIGVTVLGIVLILTTGLVKLIISGGD